MSISTTALVALAAGIGLLGIAAIWRDPYRLVRAEYRRQARALRFARRQRVVGATHWAYVERTATDPAAPTLVLLHGYTGSKENGFLLARALGRRYRLVLPDLPGWGGSSREAEGDYGYAAQADRVASFLEAIGGRPVVLVGHSMGGGIAAVVAARYPYLVSHLGLLNASGIEFADNPFGLGVLAGQNPFGVVDAASLEQYLGILFHRRAARPPIPWPAGHAVIAHRRSEGAFEQSVLDHIGRGAGR
ncbi:MAG TPA: alpha/beta fold hydrolase, partial [Luteimonas sp.]|nr:alpha/beta fold hydrolase [Luteimonas sp.]